MIWIFIPIIFVAKWLVTFKNPFKMKRGMDFMHNVIDWVGGYPYEYASVGEMTARLQKLGFEFCKFDLQLCQPAAMSLFVKISGRMKINRLLCLESRSILF